MAKSLHIACTTVVVGLLVGCATPRVTPIPKSEPVSLVVAMSPGANGSVDIRNRAVGKDAATGATSGSVVGGLSGLACGPFAVICVPIGMLAGAASGTAAGAAVGVTGALSDDKAAQLRARVAQVRQSHDVLDELRRNLTERARRAWALDTALPRFQLTVELEDLVLTSTRDEQIAFLARVRVSVQGVGGPPAAPVSSKVYGYTGPPSSLAVWLDPQSDFVDTSLSSFSQQVAAQIVSELASE